MTKQDGAKLRRYYKDCNYGLCEYSLGTKLMWKKALHPAWAEIAGCLVVRNRDADLSNLAFAGAEIKTGSDLFSAMLTNPFGCVMFTFLFMIICYLINRGGISGGIEKFNNVGMPALFVMLVIIIIRSVTLPGAAEGLKFIHPLKARGQGMVSADGALAGFPAHGQLAHHDAEAHEDGQQHIDDQECEAAVLTHFVGEAPDVALRPVWSLV